MRTRIPTVGLAAGLVLSLAACSGSSDDAGSSSSTSGSSGSASSGSGTLTVFAAASLNQAFPEIAKQFEAAHPGTSVKFTFNGSSTLVDQIKGGAPADVLASADQKNMTRATTDKLVKGIPELFATNVLTMVTAPGNPKHITGLNDSLNGRKLVVCAVGVPCGNATQKLEKTLKASVKPVSQEQSVTDVLGKVTSGEADAGVVYRTDAQGAGSKVATVAIPGADKAINKYPVAVTANSRNATLAQQFADYVASAKGRAVLTKYGFGKP